MDGKKNRQQNITHNIIQLRNQAKTFIINMMHSIKETLSAFLGIKNICSESLYKNLLLDISYEDFCNNYGQFDFQKFREFAFSHNLSLDQAVMIGEQLHRFFDDFASRFEKKEQPGVFIDPDIKEQLMNLSTAERKVEPGELRYQKDDLGNVTYYFEEKIEPQKIGKYHDDYFLVEHSFAKKIYSPGELDHLYTEKDIAIIVHNLLQNPKQYGGITAIQNTIDEIHSKLKQYPGSVKVYPKTFAISEPDGWRTYTIQVRKSNTDERIIMGISLQENNLFVHHNQIINNRLLITERDRKEAYCLSPRYIEKLYSSYQTYPDEVANNFVKENIMMAFRGESLFGNDMATMFALESGQRNGFSSEIFDLYDELLIASHDRIRYEHGVYYIITEDNKKEKIPNTGLTIERPSGSFRILQQKNTLYIENLHKDDIIISPRGYHRLLQNENIIDDAIQNYKKNKR